MSGKSQQMLDEIENAELEMDMMEDQTVAGAREPGTLTDARDARRRLEDYWEKRALEEELKHIDDWDE